MPQRLISLAAGLSLLLAPASAMAQDTDERWYQVELLVFSHEGGRGGANPEQWQATPSLAYPHAARFLVEPERVQANHEEHGGDSEVDEFGRQFISYPPLPEEEPDTPDIPVRTAVDDTPVADDANEPTVIAQEPVADDANDPTVIAQEPELPATPTPFIALPATEREFYGKAAYMQRSGKYRTLFHHTWLQPVPEESEALPIILDRSGDSGDWPRLQGSIKLYLSRYLHLETNLWLNTAGEQLPGDWRMPPPPLGPLSLIVEEPPVEEEELDEEWLIVEVEPLPPVEDPNQSLQALEEAGPVYPFRQAVLMQQKRRMRSSEVHYLDHPLLGVVVRLLPVDEETLQALALAEAEAEAKAEAEALESLPLQVP